MVKQNISCCQDGSDQTWSQLYITLRPTILFWIRTSRVMVWRGQEEDLADDILQDTVTSIHIYMLRVEQGISDPIVSLPAFSRTVARNHFNDLLRKEQRLIHFSLYERYGSEGMWLVLSDEGDPADIALEALTRAQEMTTAAHLIAMLPRKQRTALLTDLANLSHCPEKDKRLHTALLHVGIRLYDYRRALPADPRERSKHAALLSIAYKRLRVAFSTRENKYVA
jgi:DNA-directed RNA polymerase specialized sigma24 family protein